MQEFGLGELEIEAHAAYLLLECIALGRTVVVVHSLAQPADLEHYKRQPGHYVIAAARLELLREIGGPVAAFELHAVHEEGAEVLRKRAYARFYGIRHMVQITAHGSGIHMVEYGTGGTRSTVYDAGE